MIHSVKRALRIALNHIGYDIHKLPASQNGLVDNQARLYARLYARPTTSSKKGWLVEFVGPSGVGKTTLYNELLEQRQPTENWLTADEFLRLHNGPSSGQNSLNEAYEALLTLKLQDVSQRAVTPGEKYGLLAFFHKNLQLDATINSLAIPTPIVLHDGLLHNFSSDLLRLSQNDPAGFDRLVANRAVVYCHTSPQLMVERILQRNSEGYARPQHKGLSADQLVEQSAKVLTQKAQLIARLKERHLPCLELNMAHDMSQNVVAISQFVAHLA